MKRSRNLSTSEDSDNGSSSTCWSQHSSQPRRGVGQKPSEVFRTDLITAMKVHDSHQLSTDDYYVLADPWRQEWEKGVQVPVSPQAIPQPVTRVVADRGKEVMFVRPKKLIRTSGAEALGYVDIRTLAEGTCRYDLNEEDVAWLHLANQEFTDTAMPLLDETTMERVMEEFERSCHDNMTHAMETEEGLGIEYDEDVVCDVCRSPDGEDNNEMVFCDKCNVCVHQACYGIQKVPTGSWLCRTCALGILPRCQLCPHKGGAMKPTRSGTKWVHVSCALWIPEVSIGNPEKMEPITNVSQIPGTRWALVCCLCKEKMGACIQVGLVGVVAAPLVSRWSVVCVVLPADWPVSVVLPADWPVSVVLPADWPVSQCSARLCRTAFHVTCGLHAGLEMNTLLTDDDEVKFKSYCPQHSRRVGATPGGPDSDGEERSDAAGEAAGRRRGRARGGEEASPPYGLQQDQRVNQRKLRLEALEEDFPRFVGVEEVSRRLKLPADAVDFLFQYWKLKRKANFNQPLLTPPQDEEDGLARREQEVLRRRLTLFTHLRQDLERVRNLTYMVTRREKMKRSLWRLQEQIFHQQVGLLDQQLLSGDPPVKDLDHLFSLYLSPLQGPQPRPSLGPMGLRAKRGPLKPDKQRSGVSSPPRKDDLSREPRECVSADPPSADTRPQSTDPPVGVTAPHTDVLRPEGRRGSKREAGPDQEGRGRRKRDDAHEHEESTRKRRGEGAELKSRLASRHLDKTVSIRLVDIRSADELLPRQGTPRGSAVSLDMDLKLNKAPGWLKKSPAHGSHTPSRSGAAHLRGWGKFRIPKRSDREEQPRRPPPSSCPRTRLRVGAEGDGDLEPCLKRCHSHQLRGDSALGQRYGSDIIRRGVLAS
ncbi:protein Jade-1 isoform X2 [Antennarius striatus]